ncbi:hypothetical protein, partial [Mesorhizobium sp.]
MVAEPGQRIREGQIRVFLAWLTGAKRRLHHVPVLMSVFLIRLAPKRLGKVSENRFSFVQELLAPPATVQPWTRTSDPLQNILSFETSNIDVEYSFQIRFRPCDRARRLRFPLTGLSDAIELDRAALGLADRLEPV